MDTLVKFYTLLKREKKKERFDIILEPLQAVTQLALLSFYPKGTKLTIANNLLSIHGPVWTQGLWRSYNQDVKEDLFFLFNTIMRFNRFYVFIKEESEDFCDLFDLLVQLGKRGIDKLLLTYAATEQPALLHTLHMYRTLLDHPELFPDTKLNKPQLSVANTASAANVAIAANTVNNIDEVFIQIRNLYTSHEYIIIYQTLILLEKNPENYEAYVQGLTTLLSPKAEQIQKWINDNIVY
jgi:hypothetical protein